MKLESQVCTLEQAKKLKAFGVAQDAYFIWGEQGVITESWGVEGNEDIFYSAFTVAELGVMLDYCSVERSSMIGHEGHFCFPGGGKGEYYYFPTEAEARAQRLIIALEKGWATTTQVNQRLQNA